MADFYMFWQPFTTENFTGGIEKCFASETPIEDARSASQAACRAQVKSLYGNDELGSIIFHCAATQPMETLEDDDFFCLLKTGHRPPNFDDRLQVLKRIATE